jgi:hypothetical protein
LIKIGQDPKTKSGLRLLNDYARIFSDPIFIFITLGAILYLPLKLLGADTLIDFLYKHFTEVLFSWFVFYIPSLVAYLFLSSNSKFKKFLNYGNKELGIFISGLILLFLTFLFSVIGFFSESPLLVLPFGLMAYAFFKLCCYFPFILMARMIAKKTMKLIFK